MYTCKYMCFNWHSSISGNEVPFEFQCLMNIHLGSLLCVSLYFCSASLSIAHLQKKKCTCIKKVSLTNTSSHLASFQICLHPYHKLLRKNVSPSNIPAIWAILEARVKAINKLNFIHNLYAIQYFTYACTMNLKFYIFQSSILMNEIFFLKL